MSWYTVFYLFSLADKISSTFYTIAIIFTIISAIVFIVGGFGSMEDGLSNDGWRIWRKWVFLCVPLMVFSWFLWAFTPDKDAMLLIVAGGAVGEFVTSDESIKELPGDITTFLRKEILEATADLPEAIQSELNLETREERLARELGEKSKEELIKILTEEKPNQKSK